MSLSPKDRRKLADMVRSGDISRRVAKQTSIKDIQKVTKAVRGHRDQFTKQSKD